MRSHRLVAVLTVLVAALLHGPVMAIDSPLTYLERDPSDGKYEVIYEDAGGPKTLTTIDSLTTPALSPDETEIAFSGAVGDGSLGLYAIYTVETDGSGQTQLTSGSFGELDPAWTPDGGSIVFSLNEAGSLGANCCRLARVFISTGSTTTLTGNIGAIRPDVSPSGDLVTFDTPNGIYTMPLSGGSPTLRASGGFDGSFSPDGKRIAYLWRSGNSYSIRLLTIATGVASTIFTASRPLEAPDWVDDQIYFLEYSDFGYDSRSNVTLKSVHTSGASLRVERTFPSQVAELDVAETSAPRLGVSSGDLDRDGDVDLVYRDCGSFPTSCWQVQRSTGSAFAAGEDWGDGVFFAPATDIYGFHAGDLDEDGDDDLVYRAFCGSVNNDCWRVQLSSGSSLAGAQYWGNGAFFSAESRLYGFQLDDLDGDGADDLLYRGFCGTSGNECWRVQLSTGSQFSSASNWGDSAFFSPESDEFGIHTADLNGDGTFDLVYRGYCGSTGNRCWRVQISSGVSFSSGQNWGDGVFYSPETMAYGFETGDVDGDGDDDLVYRAYCGTAGNKCWRVQLSNGVGFASPQNWGNGAFFSPESQSFGILLMDTDGDGDDDLVYRGFCGSTGNKCWRVQLSTGNTFGTAMNWGDID